MATAEGFTGNVVWTVSSILAVGEQFGGGKQRFQFDPVIGEQLARALLAVDDDEHAVDDGAGLA